jgi:hypothetical protein
MGNATRISQEDYERLKEAHEHADSDGMFDIDKPDTDSATCAMLGGFYKLGSEYIPQIKPSTLPLLSVAGVSMVAEPDGASDLDAVRDLIVAIFIIANGPAACTMLMGVSQRLAALRRLEHLAEKTPEMFDRYLNKVDQIGGDAFGELELAAHQYVDTIEGFTFEAAFDVLNQMMADMQAAGGLLPDNGEDDKKK